MLCIWCRSNGALLWTSTMECLPWPGLIYNALLPAPSCISITVVGVLEIIVQVTEVFRQATLNLFCFIQLTSQHSNYVNEESNYSSLITMPKNFSCSKAHSHKGASYDQLCIFPLFKKQHINLNTNCPSHSIFVKNYTQIPTVNNKRQIEIHTFGCAHV